MQVIGDTHKSEHKDKEGACEKIVFHMPLQAGRQSLFRQNHSVWGWMSKLHKFFKKKIQYCQIKEAFYQKDSTYMDASFIFSHKT
ncbi:MAG: hypothetical protein ACSW8A_01050 [Lachnospiraceae bacterium]